MSIRALQTQLEQLERATAAHRTFRPSEAATLFAGVSLRSGVLHSPLDAHPLLASPRPAARMSQSQSMSSMRNPYSRSPGAVRQLPALRPGSLAAEDPAAHAREGQSFSSAALKQVERAAALQLQQTLDRMLDACPETWEAELRVYELVRATCGHIAMPKSVLSEVVRQVRVHCHERGLILDQLRQFFVHAAHSFLALCKRQKLPPPPFRQSDSRAARQIEELRAEIVSLKARLAQLSQAEQSGRVRPSGGSVTAESGCASPRVHTPRDEGDVAFTDKTLAAVLVRLDRLTQPQLMVVLDAAVVKLTADARCGWVHDVAQGLSQDEASLLLALQLKSRGAPALLTAAGGQMSSSELAALVLAFLPRLETPEKAECFRAILGTMDVARVLQVAETLLRLSPDGAEVLGRLFGDMSDAQRRRHLDALAANLEDEEWEHLVHRRAPNSGSEGRDRPSAKK